MQTMLPNSGIQWGEGGNIPGRSAGGVGVGHMAPFVVCVGVGGNAMCVSMWARRVEPTLGWASARNLSMALNGQLARNAISQKHQWSSGRIHRCHRCDPGSGGETNNTHIECTTPKRGWGGFVPYLHISGWASARNFSMALNGQLA